MKVIHNISTKITAVNEYFKAREGGHSGCDASAYLCSKYGVASSTLTAWITLFNKGLLRLDNAVSVSHKKRIDKEATIIVDGIMYSKYIKPTPLNINGVDYIKCD